MPSDFKPKLKKDFFVNSFTELNLPKQLDQALHRAQFKQPTPIQAKAIPIALQGKDVIGCAQTGTGKTAAFCIPMAVSLLNNPDKNALILAPTRELALQIETFWRKLSIHTPQLNHVCLIGGASFGFQMKGLSRKPRVIIATPGRLIDHLTRKTMNLNKTAHLILDEADRLLDMGFLPQLQQILKMLPKERQTMLFTATWDSTMDKLSKSCCHNPERISVGVASKAAETIHQDLLSTTHVKKNDALLNQLSIREGQVLVFVRTKSRSDRLLRFLKAEGQSVALMHAGKTQSQRRFALESFKSGRARILVATDIVARGIDISDINHVINYDLPQSPEDYIHRIGRTGRAGSKGKALSLLTPEDRQIWNRISHLLKKTGSPVPVAQQQIH